ncbi:MAG: PcfJ domain-containing protein [Candidatus Riflebacteria bacterium]|nr:PcfJ domain-containing protein [Candidatus Riflebacteria bacterium]
MTGKNLFETGITLEPPFKQAWTVPLERLGDIILEGELSEGGACARLFRLLQSPEGKTERRMLWLLALNVQPPLILRSESKGNTPYHIFDPDAGNLDSLDPFLTDGLEAIRSSPDLKDVDSSNWNKVSLSLMAIQRHLIGQLIPDVAAISSMFPTYCFRPPYLVAFDEPDAAATSSMLATGNSIRWWLYEMIVNDATGRVGQMARVCPGVLLIAKILKNLHRDKELDMLLNFIISGERLGRVLDLAVELWILVSAPRVVADRAWEQRIRIARAGPLVPPRLLWEVPDTAAVVEDIPTSSRDNLAWFEVQSIASHIARKFLPKDSRAKFLAFTSRHAPKLIAIADRPEDLEIAFFKCVTQINHLVDFARATGRCPGRNTKPHKIIEESDRWHEQQGYLNPRLLLARAGLSSRPISPEEPLDPGPVDTVRIWRRDSDFIRFIATVGSLIEESRLMHHCVASYAAMAVEGKLQLFHGEIAGEKVTIEIAFDNGTPNLGQVSGISNKKPEVFVMHGIHTWMGDLAEALKAQTLGITPHLIGRFEDGRTASNEVGRLPFPCSNEDTVQMDTG